MKITTHTIDGVLYIRARAVGSETTILEGVVDELETHYQHAESQLAIERMRASLDRLRAAVPEAPSLVGMGGTLRYATWLHRLTVGQMSAMWEVHAAKLRAQEDEIPGPS